MFSCSVDQKKQNPNSDNNTSVAFSRASDRYFDMASSLQAIRNCEVSGWHLRNKCAKYDFESGPDNYTPSNDMTDEERAILEERGLANEREAQNPPSSGAISDVSPGQGCTKFGDVIQSQRYGQLTCKFIWLNKVKALFWMRS